MIYKVDFEGQACKQIKEKAESYQYDLKSVLKGIGTLDIYSIWTSISKSIITCSK